MPNLVPRAFLRRGEGGGEKPWEPRLRHALLFAISEYVAFSTCHHMGCDWKVVSIDIPEGYLA